MLLRVSERSLPGTLQGGLWRDRTSWRKSAQAVAVRAKPRRAKGGGAVARFAADIPELQGSMRVSDGPHFCCQIVTMYIFALIMQIYQKSFCFKRRL